MDENMDGMATASQNGGGTIVTAHGGATESGFELEGFGINLRYTWDGEGENLATSTSFHEYRYDTSAVSGGSSVREWGSTSEFRSTVVVYTADWETPVSGTAKISGGSEAYVETVSGGLLAFNGSSGSRSKNGYSISYLGI